MIPVEFAESNVVFAKDQPEYLPLPAHKTPDGVVVSCWKCTLFERLRIALSGRVFVSNLTFNHPLQPQLLAASWEEVQP